MRILGSLILLIASATLSPAGQDSPIDSLLWEGDILSMDLHDNQAALGKYLEAFKLDSTNVQTLWRVSREYIDIGEHLPETTDEEKEKQLATYEMALSYAEKAVRADQSNSIAYTRRAIANGRIALFRGIWESLSLVKQTKSDVDSALILDPNNDVANYILGRVHARVTEKPKILRWPLGLGWANLEDAIRYYEKAISLKPAFIMYRLDCARAYAEDGNYEMARRHLAVIEGLRNSDEDDDRFKEEAAQLAKEIEDE